MRITFSKCFHFCASHRLWNEECSEEQNTDTFGKCSHIHGHNFELQVSVSGPIDESTGMIIPADTLEALVQEEIVGEVDHKHLNDIEWLEGQMPTTEVFAGAIWQRIDQALSAQSAELQLEKITLWETPKIFATVER